MPTITIALADGLKPKTLAHWIIEIGKCKDLENNKNGEKIKGFWKEIIRLIKWGTHCFF